MFLQKVCFSHSPSLYLFALEKKINKSKFEHGQRKNLREGNDRDVCRWLKWFFFSIQHTVEETRFSYYICFLLLCIFIGKH